MFLGLPTSIWVQYSIVAIILAVLVWALKEFKGFMQYRDVFLERLTKQWTEALREQRAEDRKTVQELVAEIRTLSSEIFNVRHDVAGVRSDIEIVTNLVKENASQQAKRERTRPRQPQVK